MGESDANWRGRCDRANVPGPGHFSEASQDFASPACGQNCNDLPNDLPIDIAFLAEGGVDENTLYRLAAIAGRKGLQASEVLIARGILNREQYLAELARYIGADFERRAPVAGELLTPEIEIAGTTTMWSLPEYAFCTRNGRRHLLLAPRGRSTLSLLNTLRSRSQGRRSITIVPPASLRLRLFERFRDLALRQAVSHLSGKFAHFSARRRITIAQSLFAGAFAVIFALTFLLAPEAAILAAASLLSASFTCGILLRCRLILRLDKLDQQSGFDDARPEDMPVYSVLVPLYREESQVGDLLRSLSSLNWPKDRLEIFLICESDDAEVEGLSDSIRRDSIICAKLAQLELPSIFFVPLSSMRCRRQRPIVARRAYRALSRRNCKTMSQSEYQRWHGDERGALTVNEFCDWARMSVVKVFETDCGLI
jgi:hypothetical protein